MGPPIPEIDWATDLTWKLLAEAEKSENRKTLLGKKKDEVSLLSLQSLNCKCSAENMAPEYIERHQNCGLQTYWICHSHRFTCPQS